MRVKVKILPLHKFSLDIAASWSRLSELLCIKQLCATSRGRIEERRGLFATFRGEREVKGKRKEKEGPALPARSLLCLFSSLFLYVCSHRPRREKISATLGQLGKNSA